MQRDIEKTVSRQAFVPPRSPAPPRPGRKTGHVTGLGESVEAAPSPAETIRDGLAPAGAS